MLGPVFRAELLTTARRRRYYAMRVVFGAVLLAILVVQYGAWFGGLYLFGGVAPIALVHGFAQAMFHDYVVAQAVAVLFLTPAMLAGVIAEEKHRKTLHYLMASQLWSGEIVAGKLAARMLHVGVFLVLGLPVLALLGLFGGVDPTAVLLAFAATAATAFFLAGLSLLASTLALRPRGAILLAYAMLLLWPILPAVAAFLGRLLIFTLLPERFLPGLVDVLDWTYPGFGMLLALQSRGWRSGALGPAALWTAKLELLYGLLFVGLAAWRLRPISQKQEGRPRWEIRLDNRGRRRWQLRARPACGGDPMLWKEYYAARIGGVTRLLVLFSGLTLVVFAGCVAAEPTWRSFGVVLRSGYTSATFENQPQKELLQCVQMMTWLIAVVWVLGAAVTAAGGVSGEREGDTWTSLVSTLLGGGEILRAKAVGAVVRFRVLMWLLVVLWGIGLAAGALHPVGVVAAGLCLALSLAFAAMLGTYLSLRSKSTLRALVVALLVLLVVNGAYGFVPYQPWWYYHLRLGNMPGVVSDALMSHLEARELFADDQRVASYWPAGMAVNWWWSLGRSGQLLLLYRNLWYLVPLYAFFAGYIYMIAVLGFDRVVDRPRRTVVLDVSAWPAGGLVPPSEALEGV